MSNFVPGNYDLRTALIFCYHLKKTAAESHRMLVEAYGEHALGKSQCFEWFKKFRSGNFDARNEERGTWNVIYYELLKPGETVNTERYRQQMIDLNQALREKRPEYQKTQHKVILLYDNAPSHTAKPVKEAIEVQLGNIFARGLLTRFGSVRLLFICIDGTRTFWPALHFLRKCTKMAGWLVCLKRATVFLAWHPSIARQVGKMYS